MLTGSGITVTLINKGKIMTKIAVSNYELYIT